MKLEDLLINMNVEQITEDMLEDLPSDIDVAFLFDNCIRMGILSRQWEDYNDYVEYLYEDEVESRKLYCKEFGENMTEEQMCEYLDEDKIYQSIRDNAQTFENYKKDNIPYLTGGEWMPEFDECDGWFITQEDYDRYIRRVR